MTNKTRIKNWSPYSKLSSADQSLYGRIFFAMVIKVYVSTGAEFGIYPMCRYTKTLKKPKQFILSISRYF